MRKLFCRRRLRTGLKRICSSVGRVGGKARDRRHAARGRGAAQNCREPHAAADREAARQPDRHPNGGHRTTSEGLLLREPGPGVSVENIVVATGAKLLFPGEVPEMSIPVAA